MLVIGPLSAHDRSLTHAPCQPIAREVYPTPSSSPLISRRPSSSSKWGPYSIHSRQTAGCPCFSRRIPHPAEETFRNRWSTSLKAEPESILTLRRLFSIVFLCLFRESASNSSRLSSGSPWPKVISLHPLLKNNPKPEVETWEARSESGDREATYKGIAKISPPTYCSSLMSITPG